MGDDLARTMFEAAEAERTVRGDFTTTDARKGCGGRPRRWTELRIQEQDQWIAAARAANTTIRQAVRDELRAARADMTVGEAMVDAMERIR